MAPGRLFSTSTSACCTKARAKSRCSACFKSSTTDCLPRLSAAKFSLKPPLKGGHWRMASPSGDSILVTSAPKSDSSMPQNGPAATWQNSMTLTPCRGLVLRVMPIPLIPKIGGRPLPNRGQRQGLNVSGARAPLRLAQRPLGRLAPRLKCPSHPMTCRHRRTASDR